MDNKDHGPYRTLTPAELKPPKSWWERYGEVVTGTCKAVGVLLVLGGMLWIHFYLNRCDVAAKQAQADAYPARQRSADTWMQTHKLEGVATCYADIDRCDVVPKDARAPFKVDCGNDGCILAAGR